MEKVFLSIILLVGSLPAWAAQPFFVPKGPLVYDVIRKGDTIGEQRVDFREEADRLVVNTSSRIEVTFLGIPVYRFNQTTEEIWRDGFLQSYISHAVDGGAKKDLALARQENQLVGTYNDKKRSLRGDVIPSILWRVDATKASVVLDALNGKAKDTKAEEVGADQVKVGDKQVKARHFRFTGEFKREAWYDDRGYMVKAILIGRDGSEVTQQLQHLP